MIRGFFDDLFYFAVALLHSKQLCHVGTVIFAGYFSDFEINDIKALSPKQLSVIIIYYAKAG